MYLYYMRTMPNQLKENINRIKSLISEFYPDDTPDEPGYTGFPLEDGLGGMSSKGEGNMAKHQSMECSSDSADVARMINSDMDLPEWLEAKITLSADYMNTVKDYLTHQMNAEEEIINISYDDEYMEYELGEQDAGTESGESDDAAGAGTASMGVWDSGVARGVANQITNTKWSDNNDVVRGKANPKW